MMYRAPGDGRTDGKGRWWERGKKNRSPPELLLMTLKPKEPVVLRKP